MASSIVTWALIVVSNGMNVSFSTGYPSEKVCKDALNVARTGMTVQEEKDRDEKIRLEKAKADGQWRLEHPLRKPTAEDEKLCPKQNGQDGVIGYSWTNGSKRGSYCHIEDDGLVHEYPLSLVTSIGYAISNSEGVRWAKCVLIAPEDK